jgi:hypothetical protein
MPELIIGFGIRFTDQDSSWDWFVQPGENYRNTLAENPVVVEQKFHSRPTRVCWLRAVPWVCCKIVFGHHLPPWDFIDFDRLAKALDIHWFQGNAQSCQSRNVKLKFLVGFLSNDDSAPS